MLLLSWFCGSHFFFSFPFIDQRQTVSKVFHQIGLWWFFCLLDFVQCQQSDKLFALRSAPLTTGARTSASAIQHALGSRQVSMATLRQSLKGTRSELNFSSHVKVFLFSEPSFNHLKTYSHSYRQELHR